MEDTLVQKAVTTSSSNKEEVVKKLLDDLNYKIVSKKLIYN